MGGLFLLRTYSINLPLEGKGDRRTAVDEVVQRTAGDSRPYNVCDVLFVPQNQSLQFQ